MCGIIGVASKQPIADQTWLALGRDTMTHRGPNDAGEWWSADRRVGLGHRRLAIIDLSPAGHQPMHDASGLLRIIFNGEIYNFQELRSQLTSKGHRFFSNSDTEVILAAYHEWGVGCLTHLNGMFAFALHDARNQTIFLARDRAGEKPLFYHQLNGQLRFASELKALLADPNLPRRINPEALDCYLAFGYIPGDRCILQDFQKLPPAHALLFHLQTCQSKLWRYWQLPELELVDDDLDEESLLDELEHLLEDSVRRQLVADVSVGVLLSGGVDSSLVTAMAVRNSSKVKTFTIQFPEHSKYDETQHARLIARHFQTEHIELECPSVTAALMPQLARQFDEPMMDSSMIPTFLVSQLVSNHCTVALGGDGGDELFGGYGHYSSLLRIMKKFSFIPHPLRRGVALASKHILPTGFRGRNYLQVLGVELDKELPVVPGCFGDTARRKLLVTQSGWHTNAESIMKSRIPCGLDLLQRATRMDFSNYLAEDILVKVDRASMFNSLEVRSPFLDYRLIEFAFGKVPSRLKATPTQKKILLKRLVSRILPLEFDLQRKSGFSIPLGHWLKNGPFYDLFYATLQNRSSIFNQNFVHGLLKGQANGRTNSERLFSLVLFELWRKEYRVTI